MGEGNGSQRQGVGLDNGGGVEHGHGAERSDRTAGADCNSGTYRGGSAVMGLSATS